MSVGAIGTLIAFGLFAVAIIAWDLYVMNKRTKYDTISAWIIRAGKKYPAFTLVFGFTFGFLGDHLFWSMDTFDYENPKIITDKCVEFLKGRYHGEEKKEKSY